MVEHWSPKPKAVGSSPAGPEVVHPSLGVIILSTKMLIAEKKADQEKKREQKPQNPVAQRIRQLDNPVARYFSELRLEWKKITYPDRKELWRSTLVVFIFSIVVTIVIAFYDFIVSLAFKFLFGQ